MTRLSPAFPLGMVCFPQETQNLHIFEERYRELVRDCKNEKISFILVPFFDGKSYPLATEVILEKIDKEYPDGKYDITIKGVNLVKVLRLTKIFPDKLYPGAKVTKLTWDETPDYIKNEQIVQLVEELYELLNIDNAGVPTVDDMLITKIVHKIGLNLDQELALLGMAYESERQNYVIEHLNKFIPEVRNMQTLKIKAALNGHFQNIDPANF